MGQSFAPYIDGDHFLGRSALGMPWHYDKPPVNLIREGEFFVLEVAVPGYVSDDLNVFVENDVLTIEGRKETQPPQSDAYLIEEFNTHTFCRRFRLAEGIGKEKIEAECKNGILRLTFRDVPKEDEVAVKTVEAALVENQHRDEHGHGEADVQPGEVEHQKGFLAEEAAEAVATDASRVHS